MESKENINELHMEAIYLSYEYFKQYVNVLDDEEFNSFLLCITNCCLYDLLSVAVNIRNNVKPSSSAIIFERVSSELNKIE